MKRSEIRELFHQTTAAYNSILGTDFNDENLLLEFCTVKTAPKVFETLCTEHFPNNLKSNSYTDFDFFKDTKAMAFVEDRMNAVLYITDVYVPKVDSEWQGNTLSVLLHEIGHIVCIRSEYSETKQIPSMSKPYHIPEALKGNEAFGYMVWRELIADMVGNHVRTKMTGQYREELNTERLVSLFYGAKYNNSSAGAVARMISEMLTIKEVIGSKSWEEALTALQSFSDRCGFADKIYPACKIAYQQLRENSIFITKEFLSDFGEACLKI